MDSERSHPFLIYNVDEERVQSLKGKTNIVMYNSTIIDNFIIFVFDKPFIFIYF